MTQTGTPTTAQPTPAAGPATAYPLLPDESLDVLVDVADVVPNPERWLDTPNSIFGGDSPRSLIGTDREIRLREALRAIKYGLYS